jgi:hypothetical protein
MVYGRYPAHVDRDVCAVRRHILVPKGPGSSALTHPVLAVMLGVSICLAPALDVFAKRAAPKPVEPIIHNGIKYVASSKMGYVESWDLRTNQRLWEKKVYDVTINPFLEEDVQWVFITSLSIQNGKLIVVNEAGGKYTIDLKK